MGAVAEIGFDYSGLPAEAAVVARESAARIKIRLKRTAEDIFEIGSDLDRTKTAISHGHYLQWLEAEFEMSESAAKRFVAVFKRFSVKSVKLTDLESINPSALYPLASSPAEVFDEVIEQAQNGTKITAADVKKLRDRIKKYKDQRNTAIIEKDTGDEHIKQLFEKVKTATNEIIFLQDEVGKLRSSNPQKTIVIDEAALIKKRDEIVRQWLTLAWEAASPDLRQVFLDEISE